MKQHDGQNLVTIGEVAKRVGRIAQTLKNWLEWHQAQDEETQKRFPLPTPITNLDSKGTRYFKEEDVQMFEDFKTFICENKGLIADVSITRWGKRGEEIKKRKEAAE